MVGTHDHTERHLYHMHYIN